MLKRVALSLFLFGSLEAAVVIDRIAVIVGKHVVKLSDVERDLRVTAFLNRETHVETAEARRKAADRLIDQQLIRDELATGTYGRASDGDAQALFDQIRRNRYGGSEARLKQDLASYGLTEDQLRAQLLWQMTVLRFIDERFKAGVLVSDEDVRAWYDQHPEVRKASFETAAPQIRKTLEGEQVDAQFEMWLQGARMRARIEFRDAAFAGGTRAGGAI